MLEIQRRVRPGHCFQGTERDKYIKCYWEYNSFIWRTEWKERKQHTTCRMFWRFYPKMKTLTFSHSPAPSRLRELCEGKWSESRSVMSDFCDPMDYTVHGILQARISEWVARDWTQVSHIAGGFFSNRATREARESSGERLSAGTTHHQKTGLRSQIDLIQITYPSIT